MFDGGSNEPILRIIGNERAAEWRWRPQSSCGARRLYLGVTPLDPRPTNAKIQVTRGGSPKASLPRNMTRGGAAR
jgi:hypothetical protein